MVGNRNQWKAEVLGFVWKRSYFVSMSHFNIFLFRRIKTSNVNLNLLCKLVLRYGQWTRLTKFNNQAIKILFFCLLSCDFRFCGPDEIIDNQKAFQSKGNRPLSQVNKFQQVWGSQVNKSAVVTWDPPSKCEQIDTHNWIHYIPGGNKPVFSATSKAYVTQKAVFCSKQKWNIYLILNFCGYRNFAKHKMSLNTGARSKQVLLFIDKQHALVLNFQNCNSPSAWAEWSKIPCFYWILLPKWREWRTNHISDILLNLNYSKYVCNRFPKPYYHLRKSLSGTDVMTQADRNLR